MFLPTRFFYLPGFNKMSLPFTKGLFLWFVKDCDALYLPEHSHLEGYPEHSLMCSVQVMFFFHFRHNNF